MNISDYAELLLTLREQFEDEKTLDEVDINYLFGIIDTLENKIETYEQIIREGRHIVSD